MTPTTATANVTPLYNVYIIVSTRTATNTCSVWVRA
jgi:hypothetical protein